MKWNIDQVTAKVAEGFPLLPDTVKEASQFSGRNFDPIRWQSRVFNEPNWPPAPIKSSPENIIEAFQHQDYLVGLAMVISWGTMWRQNGRIYGARDLHLIDESLAFCAQNILETESIVDAWARLTGNGPNDLGWSPVMTSKTLHFLCRALGFEQDPPTAIDNAVILNAVWPFWKASWVNDLTGAESPKSWRGEGIEPYMRYMTAIRVWATGLGWTTTQLEATIFARFR